MNEGKRIEGRMFMQGGIGWTLAVLLLLAAVGFTFLLSMKPGSSSVKM